MNDPRQGGAVLQLVTPAPFGGLESIVRQLSIGLARRGAGVDVAVVVQNPSEAEIFLAPLTPFGVRTYVICVGARSYAREWLEVVKLLRAGGHGILHTHGYRADVVGLLAARYVGVPAVTTVHGFIGGGLKNRLYEWVQGQAFRGFSAVVAVSRPMFDSLRSRVSERRLHLIRNAAPPDGPPPLSRQEARGRLGLPADARVIGWVGRLSREKGCDVLLSALGMLDPPRPVVCVVGDGPERRALERLADALGVGGLVRWVGIVPEASSIFSAFDAFVLSSRREGTPVVLFEAMNAEVPIVATAVGGVPDVIGHEALLVPPERPEVLCVAVRAVLDEPAAARARASRARARLQAEFGTDRWLDRYQGLYEALALRHGRRATTRGQA